MKCKKCGAKVSKGSKYCPECGCKLLKKEGPFECPECGEEVDADTNFCPSCGFDFSEYDEEDDDEYDDEDEEYEDEDEDYEEEDEEEYDDDDEEVEVDMEEFEVDVDDKTRDKMMRIIDSYLDSINSDGNAYDSEAVMDPENSEIFDNVLDKITEDEELDDILAFIDNTLMGSGKGGLVFTTRAIYEKDGLGKALRIPYGIIEGARIEGDELIFDNTEILSDDDEEVRIVCSFYEPEALMNCIEELVNLF